MSQYLSAKKLRALAQVCEMGKLDELDPAIQAIIEGKPLGESSLDSRIVDVQEGFAFTEANFHETIYYRGQRLKRHRNGGGWVPAEQSEADQSKPFVAESAYVGPWAMVYGNARVYGNAGIYGKARVYSCANVYGDAWVYDNAEVFEYAWVYGTARVFGNTRVHGYSRIYDQAWIRDNAEIYGKVRVCSNSVVGGERILSSGNFVGMELL